MKTWIVTIIAGLAIICAGPLLDSTAKSAPKTDTPPFCTELGGPNAGHVIKDNGTLVCTDKRGKALKP